MIIGSDVFFFHTSFGRSSWGDDDTIVCPTQLELLHGKIVNMNEEKDYVHVYVEGVQHLLCFGYCFHENYIFESAEEAIAEMTKQLQNL